MNIPKLTEDIVTSISYFETKSPDIDTFTTALQTFFSRLYKKEVIIDYWLTFSSGNKIRISVQLDKKNHFKETYIYDRELYDGSTN